MNHVEKRTLSMSEVCGCALWVPTMALRITVSPVMLIAAVTYQGRICG